jgi:multidrug efflux pump subunit AcrA (membrane-fusion protein)
VIGVAAVVILAAAGIGAYAATGGSGSRYRTATVTMASVARTLAETGTAAQQTSDDATFASAGTVRTVVVRAGQQVTAGAPLATLDTTALTVALNEAKATTAEARLTLTEAEDGTLSSNSSQSGGGGGGFAGSTTADTSSATTTLLATSTSRTGELAADVVSAPVPTTSGRPTGPTPTGTAGTSTPALVTAVVADQHTLDGDLTTAKTLLSTTTAACAPSAGASPTAPTSTTATPTASPSPQPTAGDSCAADEAGLLQAEQHVAADETSLAGVESSLDTALEKAASTTATTTRTGTTRPTTGTGTAGKTNSSSGSAATTTVSASQLAAYESKVDAAVAAQAVAQQDLQLATLTSPLSGTVQSVDLTAGSSSSGGGITIAAPGGVVYTTSLPVDTVEGVAVGQTASIVPDGTSAALPAKVVAVAAAPDSSGDYTVTVGLDSPKTGIRTGATAALSITTASAADVLTVPTSAITSVGSRHVVRVLKGSTVTAVPVTVTVQGPVRTQVAGSLTVGETIVLADLSEAVPASNSDTTTTRTGGLGGTTTGGFGGATGGFGGGTGGTGRRGG